MKKLGTVVFVVAISLLAISLVGCGNSNNQSSGGGGATQPNTTQTQPAGNTVTLQNFAFNPQNITIAVGDSVTWINKDSANHTVTGDKAGSGDDFDSGSFASGAEFKHTFTQAGTYPYHCSIHTNMKGTVTVQ
jgi:plastocyanin